MDAYYNFSKFLLSSVGLWPYGRTKLQLVKKTLSFLLTVTFIIPQCLVFTHSDLTMHRVLKNLSTIMMSLGAVLKYTAFWYQADVFKEFLKQLMYDWKVNQGERLKILKNRASLGKFYGKLFASFIYPSAFLLVMLDMSDLIAVIIVPRNATYTSHFPVEMDYMIDEQTYYFPIIAHRSLSVLVIATVYASSESLFFMLLEHVAGLFSVTSYCITKAVAMDSDDLNNKKGSLSRNSMETFVEGVSQHRRAIELLETLRQKITSSYGLLIVLGVLSLSVNLYSLSLTIRDGSRMEESLTSLLFAGSELAYMFYVNYMVQQLLDSIDNLVPFIYATNWYDASIMLQKLILLVMMKGSKEYAFTFSGFYSASVEGFSELLKKSVSGLTMMTSM